MKKYLLSFILSFLSIQLSFGQKENYQWLVGSYGPPYKHSILDFNSGSPVIDSLNSAMRIFLTNASICDTSGQMLFYTNGIQVFNQNHDTLLNSEGINPGWATNYYGSFGMGIPQGAFIIPRPGNSGQYYLFHESAEYVILDAVTSNAPVNLSYSMVDMTLDGGLGGISSGYKNLIAVDDTLVTG